ncbi:MAG: class I tRNA ligase family protein, partial [Cellulomonadaceae bacterium]
CVSHGIILGDDGRKASKSLRNFPDPMEMFDKYGSDAVRWTLMSSPVLRGGNLVVAEESIRDAVRQVLLPLWSTYYFFTLYADAGRAGEGLTAHRLARETVSELPDMDRYLLARTGRLVQRVQDQLDVYDVAGACESVREHLDVLTNWYVRTQRQRFWDEDQAAFDTLWTALEVLLRVMAPLAPMVAEEIWRGLTGGRSVHLTDWPALVDAHGHPTPDAEALVADDELVAAMDRVRTVCSASLGVRKAHQLRVRQPLARLTVAVDDPGALEPYTGLLATELNVKEVGLVELSPAVAERYGVSQRLNVNARAAGPRLGRGVQGAIRAAKAGDWRQEADGGVVVATPDGDVPLQAGEYELATVVAGAQEGAEVGATVLPGGGFVVLDLALDDDLLAEGYARDLVREIQDARKAAGLNVADRIALSIEVPSEWRAAVTRFRDLLARETLAVEVRVSEAPTAERAIHLALAAPVSSQGGPA